MNTDNNPNSFSRVIHKNYNDKKTQDLVNSYNYSHTNPKKYRKWSPDISYEERFKKKRTREEDYMKDFHPEDKPILLVNKKHEYKGVGNPALFKDPDAKESYYKVSENTNEIDDISKEIQGLKNFIRRKTLVHKPKNLDEETEEGLSSIYKVEGKEFLPEGFIELDPLLMKDDYQFESKIDEKLFREEQRKLKVLRRKQYEQRDQKKIRDVTIFVLDEKKGKIVDFLDKWDKKHKRPMNKRELGYVSKLLKEDPHKMALLQDLYYKKKKIEHNKKYDNKLKRPKLRFKDIPFAMTGGMEKKDGYKDVNSQYLKNVTPHIPSYLDKYRKKMKLNQSNENFDNDKTMIKSIGDQSIPNPHYANTSPIQEGDYKTMNDNFEKMVNTTNPNGPGNSDARASFNYDSYNKSVKNKDLITNQTLNGDSSDKDEELKKYFDDEIHSILNKIKSVKPEKEDPYLKDARKSIMSKINEEPEELTESQKIINSFKQKLMGSDPNLQNIVKEAEVKKNAFTDFKNEANESGLKNWSFTNLMTAQRPIMDKVKRVSIIGKNKNGDTFITQKLKPVPIGNEYLYQTVEDITKDEEGKRVRTVSIITKNDQGQVISKLEVDPENIGQNYENEIIETEPAFEGDKSKLVVVKNENGEIAISQKLTPTVNLVPNDDLAKGLEIGNFKKPQVQKEKNITTCRLSPVHFKDKVFVQELHEIEFPDGSGELKIITKDDKKAIIDEKKGNFNLLGDSYYSSIEEYHKLIDPKKGDDEDNIETVFRLETRNNKGDLICHLDLDKMYNKKDEKKINPKNKKTNIYKLNPVNINDNYLTQEIEEKEIYGSIESTLKTFDKDKNLLDEKDLESEKQSNGYFSEVLEKDKKLYIITKNKKDEIVGEYEVPEEISKLNELTEFDTVEQKIDDKGERKSIIAIKDKDNKRFKSTILRPTLIGNKYYVQTVNELLDKEETVWDEKEEKGVIVTMDEEGNIVDKKEIDPKLLSDNYYNKIVDESIDEYGNRRITLHTFNDQDELIAEKVLEPKIKGELENEDLDFIVEEIIDENDNKKLTALNKNEKGVLVIAGIEDLKPDETLIDKDGEKEEEDEEDDDDEEEEEEEEDDEEKGLNDKEKNAYFEDLLKNWGKKKNNKRKTINPDLEEARNRRKTWAKYPKMPKKSKSQLEEITDESIYNSETRRSSKLKGQVINRKSVKKPRRRTTKKVNGKNVPYEESVKKQSHKKTPSIVNKLYEDRDVKERKSLSQKKNPKGKNRRTMLVKDYKLKNKGNDFSPDEKIRDDSVEDQRTSVYRRQSKPKKVKFNKDQKDPKTSKENQKKYKGRNTLLLEDQDKLKNLLNESDSETDLNNIDITSTSKKTDKNKELKNNNSEDELNMRKKIREAFEKEKGKISQDILEKIRRNTGVESIDELLDDFYQFCRKLQKDSKYKESVLFATLFYYYIQKKKIHKAKKNLKE